MSNLYIGTQRPKSIYVDTSKVKAVYFGTEKVWSGDSRARVWNLTDRVEVNRVDTQAGSYIFDAGGSTNRLVFESGVTDHEYWTNGYFLGQSTTKIKNGPKKTTFGTLSNITANGFTYTQGNTLEGFIVIPYEVKAGEIVKWTYTRSGTNRGGYILFNSNGEYISSTLLNRSGSGTITESVSITQDGWICICFGKYNQNDTLIVSDISLSIS